SEREILADVLLLSIEIMLSYCIFCIYRRLYFCIIHLILNKIFGTWRNRHEFNRIGSVRTLADCCRHGIRRAENAGQYEATAYCAWSRTRTEAGSPDRSRAVAQSDRRPKGPARPMRPDRYAN